MGCSWKPEAHKPQPTLTSLSGKGPPFPVICVFEGPSVPSYFGREGWIGWVPLLVC